MKKAIFIIVLFLSFGLYGGLFAQCNMADAIFPITDSEQAFLYYLSYTNSFDTAFVNCKIGEFRVTKNNDRENLIIIRSLYKDNVFEGDSTTGEDLTLRAKSYTNNFVYETGSSLSFYRELSVGVFFGKGENYPSKEELNNLNWLDKIFVVGKNRILDRTEFVIQLVRASDAQVLYTIDSAGIDVNPNNIVAPIYGTSPESINHTVNLPDNYAGEEVYIRISPRRWGTAPYGMKLSIEPAWISLSTLFEYGANNNFFKEKCSQSQNNTLDSMHFARVMKHCDTIKSITGHLPTGTIERKPMSEAQNDTIIKYYYDTVNYEGHIFYKEKDFQQGAAGVPEELFGTGDKDINIIRTYPNPINKDEINIVVHSKKPESNCYFEICNINGLKFIKSTEFAIAEGENIINKKLNLFPGAYFFILRNSAGQYLGSVKIIKE